jgi:long-chain acyl-CoA synthetase
MTKKPPFNQQVPGIEQKDGHGIPRRHPGSIEGLKSQPDPSIATLYDIVQFGARVYGKNKCMGSRKLIKTHTEEKKIKKIVDGEETEVPKKWTYYEMSEYSYISFNDYKEKVDIIGSGLRALGMTKGDLVHLFAATRYVLQREPVVLSVISC